MSAFRRPRPRMDRCIATTRSIRPVLHTYRIPDCPENVRAVFAADFHLTARMDPDALLAPILEARPDLILLGGDFADDKPQALRLFEAMRALRPRLGIYCAIGNNDREAFDRPEDLARALDRFGARLLLNESTEIGGMMLGGLDEYKHGIPRYDSVFPDRKAWRLLLSHYPILPDAPREAWPNAMLSGHTHGGQFNLFGLTPYSLFFESARYRPALISGMESFGGMTLLTPKGIGCSRLPLRIGAEPEICLVLLGKAE